MAKKPKQPFCRASQYKMPRLPSQVCEDDVAVVLSAVTLGQVVVEVNVLPRDYFTVRNLCADACQVKALDGYRLRLSPLPQQPLDAIDFDNLDEMLDEIDAPAEDADAGEAPDPLKRLAGGKGRYVTWAELIGGNQAEIRQRLPAKYWPVYDLLCKGLEYKDIAAQLGITTHQVKGARQGMRDRIERMGFSAD